MGTGRVKITVVTVTRNAADCLEQTIRSVLAQEYEPLDYILIDGASTDGTLDVVNRHAASLAYWISEPDSGIYDAMNKGWSLADDDSYVLFLGAGDLLLSLPAPDSFCGSDVVYGNARMAGGRLFKGSVGIQLRIYNSLHHQAMLVKKTMYPKPPFDLKFPRYADFDFNQRLYLARARFSFSPSFLAYAAPGGVTEKLDLEESTAVIKKNFGYFFMVCAQCAYLASRVIPGLKRFRPIKSAPCK